MSTQPTAIQKAETSPLITEFAAQYKMTAATMLQTVKETVFPDKGKDITIPQLMMFLSVASQYNLSPFTREIYAFPTRGGGVVPIVPIDGWANIINRHPQMDGLEFIDEWIVPDSNKPHEKSLFSVTCIIYRKDRKYPTKVTEYMHECAKDTEPWRKWSARMLRHKSMIQCARVAFSLAGIYDPDEAERIAESETNGKTEVTRPQRIVEGTVVTEAQPASTSEPAQNGGGAATSQEEARVEDNRSSAPTSSPSAAEVGFSAPPSTKPEGPYVGPQKISKLMAVAHAASLDDDKIHKILKEKFNIDSRKEIPEKMYTEVLKAVGGDELKIK
jgi:phage recombination protein Bet